MEGRIGIKFNEIVRNDLFENAMQGKWEEVVQKYKKWPWVQKERITAGGNTALHIAVSARQASVVKKLVQVVGGGQGVLDIKNEQGNTPLHLAASIGSVSICSCMASKDPNLVGIPNKEGETSLFLAAYRGKVDAFFYLLDLSDRFARKYEYLRNKKGETILHYAIAGEHFKLAYLIAQRGGDLTSSINEEGVSPLHLLAGKPAAFQSGTHLNLFDKIIYHCLFIHEFYKPRLPGDDKDSKNPTLTELLRVPWGKIRVPTAFGRKAAQKASDSPDAAANLEGPGIDQDQDGKREQLENQNQFPQNYNTCFSFIKLLDRFNFLKLPIRALYGSVFSRTSKKDQHIDEEDQPWNMTAEILEEGSSSMQDETREPNENERSRVWFRQYLESQRGFPPNYDTCFNFITFLIKGIFVIIFLGLGRWHLNNIEKKKVENIWSVKLMHLLLENKYEYDSTGKNPLYSEKTLPYIMQSKMKIGMEEDEETSVLKINGGELVAPTDEVKKAKKEVKVAEEDTYQKNYPRHHSSEEDANWALLLRLSKAGLRSEPIIVAGQAAKKLDDELHKEAKKNNEKAGRLETPILIAARNGIKEMVKEILEVHPMAIHDVNSEEKNIILLAVENRQAQLYQLLVSWRNVDPIALCAVDQNGNSALHLAATLGEYQPYPFAALQMQWEFKWYEFVKNSIPPYFFIDLNQQNQTPEQVFTETHRDLVEKGGKWLNSTSNSCSLVATLITTVAFATTASVPGGMKEDGSRPNLERHPGFFVFAISSLIALSSSITSVITFLAILTSRYHQVDFQRDLPRKLLLALTSLFVSLAAMLVCFCAGHFFLLKDELKHAALPLYSVAFLPITIFALLQFPFYFDLILATFKKVPQRTPYSMG